LEVVPRFLENLWTPVIYREIFYVLHWWSFLLSDI
jgi:hypothetical protein